MTNNRTASTVTLPRREAAMALALLGMIAALGSDPVRANDADNAWIAQIDLGVDIGGILKTPDAVRAFLVSL